MDAKTIQLAKINTKDNIADPMTKSLVRQDHSRLVSTTMGAAIEDGKPNDGKPPSPRRDENGKTGDSRGRTD
jgi:hypothetical protein